MTSKELLIGVVVPIGTGIISAVAVWVLTPDWEAAARSKGWVPSAEWQADARRQGWIPESECPGFPVTLRISSPGDGASLRVRRDTIYSRFVVEPSRPIRDEHTTYLAIQKKGDTNLYLFERLYSNTTGLVTLPFEIDQPIEATLWALVVSVPAAERNDNRKGEIYTDIAQLKTLRGLLCISDPIRVSLTPDK